MAKIRKFLWNAKEGTEGEGTEGKEGATGTEGTKGAEGAGATEKTPEQIKAELEAEFDKKLQSEADKRVTDALKKAEKKWKEELAERERQAKLSEEEKKAEEDKKRIAEQMEKERLLNIKELKLELVDLLVANGMDLGFKELIAVDQFATLEEGKERTKALEGQVKAVKAIFDNLVEKKTAEIKQEYLKGETPKGANNKEGNTPPNAYDKAKQAGNVREMLKAKFASKGQEE